jgi:hypothetical protein
MKPILCYIFFFIVLIFNAFATDTTLVYRSEYEDEGDVIFDLNAPGEGNMLLIQ